jgi:hypothetical protein
MDGLNLINLEDVDEMAITYQQAEVELETEVNFRVPRSPTRKQKYKIRLHSVSPLNKGGLGQTRYEDWESVRKIPGKRGNKKKWKGDYRKKSMFKPCYSSTELWNTNMHRH